MGVTLKDIAKACNVSFSTVSKALKGSREIGGETIKLVTETAQKMGYRPNLAARTLRTNRSYDIGVIFEDSTGSGLQHQYFAEIFDSLNVAANCSSYSLTFLNSFGKNEKSYLDQALYRGVDGIVVASTDFTDEGIQRLIKSEVPVSILDYDADGEKPSVLSDNYEGMKSLVEYIISKNHKRIAYIHGELSEVTDLRIKAYKDTLKENGIEADEGLLKAGRFHRTDESEAFTDEFLLLPLEERPTCIIYPDDFASLGGVKSLSHSGLKVGKDISIAGYDGILLSKVISPGLTTYSQNAREIGRALIESLLLQIENKAVPPFSSVFIKGHLIEGSSVCSI